MTNYKELIAELDNFAANCCIPDDEETPPRKAAAILRRLDAAQGSVDGVMQLASDLDDYGAETPNKAKIRDALRTAVEALALGGWQPIETAKLHEWLTRMEWSYWHFDRIEKAEYHGGSFEINGDTKKWVVTVVSKEPT